MDDEEQELITRTFDEKFKALTYKVGQYASGILALGIALWWIFYGTVEILPTTLSITERLGLTFATVLLALSYCKLISRGGFKSARATNSYKKQTKEWSELIKLTIQDRQAINEFAKDEAIKNLAFVRRQNIENNEMVYAEFFDSDNKFIGKNYQKRDDLTRKQKKVISKILKIKVCLPNLFGASSAKVFGIAKERTQRSYELRTDIVNLILRLGLSIVSVSLMFNFLGFSVSSFVFAIFQIVLWTASGFSQRLKNFDWVIGTQLPQIIEKKLTLLAWTKLDESRKNSYRIVSEKKKEATEIKVQTEIVETPIPLIERFNAADKS